MADIPDKPFYKIGEVCHYTDTQPYVLRFWESEFPGLAPEKNRSGQRMYTRRDIDLVLRIKHLLYEEEFTIAGARKKLEQEEAGPAAPETERTAAEARAEPEAEPLVPPARAETSPEPAPLLPAVAEPPVPPSPAERARVAVAETEIAALRKRIAELEGRHVAAAAALEASEDVRRRERERRERVASRLEALLRSIERGTPEDRPGALDA